MKKLLLYLLIPLACMLTATVVHSDEKQLIDMVFIKQATEVLPKLSNLQILPKDDGVHGGAQAIMDNNTTGDFLGHQYQLKDVILDLKDNVQDAVQKLFNQGFRQFIVDIGAEDLLAVADSQHGKQSWFYNIGAADDYLRTEQCRNNVLHLVPSFSMRADAIAQYLISKKWKQWFLVSGRRQSDAGFSAAMRHAAKKFGGKLVAEKDWDYSADMRRLAAATVPVFTQGIEYDVLIVADVIGEFGEYLMYRTWSPRPVVGTQGLMPVTWHRSHEQWGAAQLQSRFFKNFNHYPSEKDYGVWSAVRTIGEAVTRSGSVNDESIARYIRSPDFSLAGYKGQKMSFRLWNLQLRQPIILVSNTSLVAVSPQHQFLHERSPLDTLGYDLKDKETKCKLVSQ